MEYILERAEKPESLLQTDMRIDVPLSDTDCADEMIIGNHQIETVPYMILQRKGHPISLKTYLLVSTFFI